MFNCRSNNVVAVKLSLKQLRTLLSGLAVLCLFVFPDSSLAARHQSTGTPAQCKTISIVASKSLLQTTEVRMAVTDAIALLRQGFPTAQVMMNTPAAQIRIVLPDPKQMRKNLPSHPARHPRYPLLQVPWSGYHWHSRQTKNTTELRLEASSPQGVACGLYGLLQERLGFKFIHPRETLLPHHVNWPLPSNFHWQATPRFEKRGFHLHTLHPTELAEQLNTPAYPSAFADAREYLDWLARNGQNVMQFYLLRDADTDAWIKHARQIVSYARSRGIKVGVAVSLSMIQQRSFQVLHLLRPFPSYRSQINSSLTRLFRVPWDFVTLELTMGEYLPNLETLLPETTEYLVQEVTGKYRTRLFFATHVIRRANKTASRAVPGLDQAGPGTGILIHSVMNYALSDPSAPVYGNKNLSFMLDRAVFESKHRETWYWPESSYWIAYDSSVPLFLLTYLDSRWRDMNTAEKIGLPGHLTFSSGWEWGYWLVDWSIARWSWRYAEKGATRQHAPLSCLEDLFLAPGMAELWKEALSLENLYLKAKGLISYQAAATPFAELPRPFRKSFQPAAEFSAADLFRGTTQSEQVLTRKVIADLNDYAGKLDRIVARMSREIAKQFGRETADQREVFFLASELKNCLAMSALRAHHRAVTIRALVAREYGRPAKGNSAGNRGALLQEAAALRLKALQLVREQESHYRYPIGMIARQRESITAYRFGYLYPVSTLFFWKREEEQLRQGRFDPFFMNLWDFRRVLGLEGLFF
ncbi:MAG: hypothetical protein AB9919_11510 [Geobacteraceae bacterium]